LIKENTIDQVLISAYDILKVAGIDSYIIDAQLLLAKSLGKDRLYVVMNRGDKIEVDAIRIFMNFIELRKNRIPVKYIIEECEFMGLELFVKKGVLIPRPDTEILVEEAINKINENGYNYICDVCSGSGAIGVSIGKFVETVKVDCYDISKLAEEVNKINIQRLELQSRVKFYISNLLEEAISKEKVFDAIISNPPYIKEAVIPTLMEDVKDHEPYIALSGGLDGLDFYRKITEQSTLCLREAGMLAFEIGYDQKEEVEEIMKYNGFTQITCLKDLAGNDRVLIGIKQ
jgi:release factor glutamine methyltransferase